MQKKKVMAAFVALLALCCLLATTAFAAGTSDVAGAVERTWPTAASA